MRTAVRSHDRAAAREARADGRRVRVVVRRVEPWSVLKFSLLFYFCVMLIFLFALAILYWVLGVTGVLDSVEKTLGQLMAVKNFEIDTFWVFSRLFAVGLLGVVLWSLVNVFVALLYNLVSDVVGGVRVSLSEVGERPDAAARR